MSTISLFQFSALVLWPLLFSICTLLWSDRQSKAIEYLIRAKSSLRVLERDLNFEHETAHRLADLDKELRSEARHHSHSLRQIKQGQRAKFLRLKGIPEEGHGTENTAEKVSELLEYLGFEIEAADIERANRVGGRDHDGPRAIVMELNSERLKHAILGEAAVKLRHTPYSILDDETFVVMEESEAMYVPDLGVGCGLISHVEDPELVKKSGRMFGFWGTDSTNNSEKIFIMEHFYKNAKVIEFENLSEFKGPTAKPRVHTMPYNWGGTGHLVLNDCIYFNRFNTSNIVQTAFAKGNDIRALYNTKKSSSNISSAAATGTSGAAMINSPFGNHSDNLPDQSVMDAVLRVQQKINQKACISDSEDDEPIEFKENRSIHQQLARRDTIARQKEIKNLLEQAQSNETKEQKNNIKLQLSRRLSQRPSASEIKDRGILKVKSTQERRDEKEKIKKELSRRLSQRPTVQTLIKKNVIKFEEYVDVYEIQYVDRKADKPWTRLTATEKASIRKELNQYKVNTVRYLTCAGKGTNLLSERSEAKLRI